MFLELIFNKNPGLYLKITFFMFDFMNLKFLNLIDKKPVLHLFSSVILCLKLSFFSKPTRFLI